MVVLHGLSCEYAFLFKVFKKKCLLILVFFLYSQGVPCSLRFWNLLAIQPRAVQPSLFTYGLSSHFFWPMGYPAQYYWSTHGQMWKTCGLSSPTVLINLWAIQPKAIQPSLLTLWAMQPNYLTIGIPAQYCRSTHELFSPKTCWLCWSITLQPRGC